MVAKDFADTIVPRTTLNKADRKTEVPVMAIMPQATNDITDHSGHITTGGTSQVLMEANEWRQGMWIQNQSAEPLFVNELGQPASNDNGSMMLAPGALWEAPFGGLSMKRVSIWGATTDLHFAAREW